MIFWLLQAKYTMDFNKIWYAECRSGGASPHQILAHYYIYYGFYGLPKFCHIFFRFWPNYLMFFWQKMIIDFHQILHAILPLSPLYAYQILSLYDD